MSLPDLSTPAYCFKFVMGDPVEGEVLGRVLEFPTELLLRASGVRVQFVLVADEEGNTHVAAQPLPPEDDDEDR